jgi:hypothetical protein
MTEASTLSTPYKKVSREQVVQALEASAGMVATAARKLGIHRQTIYNMIKSDPTIKDERQRIRDEVVDLAEATLLGLIRDKNVSAIIFFLKTQGRNRGYVENAQINIDPTSVPSPIAARGHQMTAEQREAARRLAETLWQN